MEPPKRFVERILECCAILALSAFLLRLAVSYVLEVWPYLLTGASTILIAVVGFRIWKYMRDTGKW